MAAAQGPVPPPGATFWSGTCGAQWRLGQRISAGDIAAATSAAAAAPADDGAGPKRSGARSGVTLAQLVQAGVVQPGQGVITVSYKGASYTASLNAAGAIEYEGSTFVSPTAFSIHVKRKQTPGKAGDDGWVSVHYLGRPLAEHRREYVERSGARVGSGRQQQGAAGPSTAATATAPAPAAAPRLGPGRSSRGRQRRKSSRYSESDDDGAAAGPMEVDGLFSAKGGPSPLKVDGDLAVDLPPGAEVPGCDEWVQCDRCQLWRLVPQDWAQAVRDDTRQEWLCEYAQWDVATQPPHKPACDAGVSAARNGGGKRRAKRR